MLPERRKSQRWPTFFGGRILFNNKLSSVSCVVRNKSDAGVKVTFTNTTFVPDEFDLEISQKSEAYRAHIIWRQVDSAGAEIVPIRPSDTIVSFDKERRTRQLERENAELRRRLSDERSPL